MLERNEYAGDAIDDAAAMSVDIGGDRRGAARGSFGERETPAFGERCAGHQPRLLIQLDELGVAQLAGQMDPITGTVVRDAFLQRRPQRAFAHDHQLQPRHAPLGDSRRVDQLVLALHRRQPADTHDGGHRGVAVARMEHVFDAVVHGDHPLRLEAEVQQIVTSRLTRRQRQRPPVERRRQPGLDRSSHERERPGQQLIPHRSVHMVQERDARLVAPQRAQPRHAVPHLDERVVVAA